MLNKYFNKTLKVLKWRPIKPIRSKTISPDFWYGSRDRNFPKEGLCLKKLYNDLSKDKGIKNSDRWMKD
jgi:hypothetical protein